MREKFQVRSLPKQFNRSFKAVEHVEIAQAEKLMFQKSLMKV